MDEQEAKILKDYIPTESNLLGGFDISPNPVNPLLFGSKDQGPYDYQRGDQNNDEGRITNKFSPFELILKSTSETAPYSVAVYYGYICERLPGPDQAIINHPPANILDGDELREFSISPGQSLFVKCHVNEFGNIASPPAAIIRAVCSSGQAMPKVSPVSVVMSTP